MAKKALIAMSGGVDSSVAAYLMKEAGYDCIGVTMKLYDNEDIGMAREKTCCSLSDIEMPEACVLNWESHIMYLILKMILRKKLLIILFPVIRME